jgi:hypothetical protein
MQLSDFRAELSGWLQDNIAADADRQWPAANLNRKILLALRETAKHILTFDPDSLKWTYTAATKVPSTGKDNIYSYPAGTMAVHEIALSSDGVSYLPLQRLSLKNIRDDRAYGYGLTGFVPYDSTHFVLWPSASSVVAAGLRVIVATAPTMTDDTDPYPLPLGFENLTLLEAQKFALRDVGEPIDKVQAEINQLKVETPRFYLTNDLPPMVQPLVDRGY